MDILLLLINCEAQQWKEREERKSHKLPIGQLQGEGQSILVCKTHFQAWTKTAWTAWTAFSSMDAPVRASPNKERHIHKHTHTHTHRK
eukprot:scaffold86541_cov18-Tisochrysis_lutea.AAC.2